MVEWRLTRGSTSAYYLGVRWSSSALSSAGGCFRWAVYLGGGGLLGVGLSYLLTYLPLCLLPSYLLLFSCLSLLCGLALFIKGIALVLRR